MNLNLRVLFSILALILARDIEAQTYDTNNVAVQTFVGSGFYGYHDGQGQLTMFNNPTQVAVDTLSNLFVLDSENYCIRKVTPDGIVSKYCDLEPGIFGQMTIDHSNVVWMTVNYNGNFDLLRIQSNSVSIPFMASNYGTNLPGGVCVDTFNRIYISDPVGNKVYVYHQNFGSVIFAGSGNPGSIDGNWIFTSFRFPSVLTADSLDNIFIWDSGNKLVRKVSQNRDVTTFAGIVGYNGDRDGTGTSTTSASLAAGFRSINGMCIDNTGSVIMACGSSVRKMDSIGNVTTLAGSFNQSGYTNGVGSLARFSSANGVCYSQGSIFIGDTLNQRIRQITFNQNPQIVSGANLEIGTYAGLNISGIVGRSYRIESSLNLTNWAPETTLILTKSLFVWIDPNPIFENKFFRALLIP